MARTSLRSNRGAILLNVATGLMVFIGVTAFVVDYGVMWVGRGQAQNAADAGALAGAVAMAFDTNGWTDRTPTGPARASALRMAQVHSIWGQPPNVDVNTDVFFTGLPAAMCPADANGRTPCIRVDVYRNQARNNPLPAIFGLAVGLVDQGVRATATARVAVADASDCLKPWIIPDKWADNHDTTAPIDSTWTLDDTFETGDQQGQTWTPFNPPDVYTPPSSSGPGTGFTVAADLGMMVTLKAGGPQTSISPGVYFPVRIPTYAGGSTGGSDYRANISRLQRSRNSDRHHAGERERQHDRTYRAGRLGSHRAGPECPLGSRDEVGHQQLRPGQSVVWDQQPPDCSGPDFRHGALREHEASGPSAVQGGQHSRLLPGSDAGKRCSRIPDRKRRVYPRAPLPSIDPQASFLTTIQLIR